MDKSDGAAATQSLEPKPKPAMGGPTATPGVMDPNGAMGVMGASAGPEGTHHGSVRGQLVGPSEGIARSEQGGNAVGGSELAKMISSIIASLAGRSGVPNPAPAPPTPGAPSA